MSLAAQTLDPPSRTLMFLEGRAIHELGAFLGALPLLSLAPRGDGHPVLVLPGLVASDTSTRPLRSFLKNRGYVVSGWRQGRNLGLRPGVQHAMTDLVKELNDTRGRKVSLVGWSLGGLYARQLAKLMPERVRSVVTLGSPFAAGPKATNAWRVYEMASGRRADEEDGRFGGALAGTPPVPTTAIFSRELGEHRGREQPLRHGPSSRGSLCGGRSPGASGRQVETVRPQRLAQHRLSRSEQVVGSDLFPYLAPLFAGRGRNSR